MEENVSPELSLAPEQSQDAMESSSQGVTEEAREEPDPDPDPGEDASQEKLEDAENSAKAAGETRKTWGFRRTTIAKREMPGEPAPESQEGRGAGVRRSGRQAKRTDKLEEFLLTTKRGRPTGRKSGSANLESGDPPSQTPTDAETASEASFDGNTDVKSVDDKSPERKTRSRSQNKTLGKAKGGRGRGASVSDDGSSENEHEHEEEEEVGSGDAPTKPQPKPHESQDQGQPDQDKEEDQDQEKPSLEESAMESTAQPQTQTQTQPQTQPDSVKEEVEEIEKKEDDGKEEKEQENEKEPETDEKEESSEKPKETGGKRASLRTYSKAANKGSAPLKGDGTPKGGLKTTKAEDMDNDSEDDDEEESLSSSSSSSESDDSGYDPNALYCICRQKHNKRFMICCDRCFEWFHGDCVGITEARGRLMERNGEDYICPNCTAKKSQVTRSATSPSAAGTENGKPKAIAVPGSCKAEASPSVAALSPTASAVSEERVGDDMGIKGRIEKATNPSGKKKIKIFQPQQTAEESSLPKCIGPGCDKNALPDSVYCGNDCILRHAAAAMKSITGVKEPKQKNKPKTQRRPGPRTTPKKCSGPGKRASKKSTDEEESDSEEDDDDEEQHAEERPPPPAMSSWSSDHNYNAVTPEKTTPISPTVLNKTSPQEEEEEEEESEEEQKEQEPAPPEKKSPAPTAPPKAVKKSLGPRGGRTATKGKKASTLFGSAKSSKKQLTPPSKKRFPPPPSIPHNPAAGPLHATGALRVTKSTFTIPKKQPHTLPPQRDSPSHSQSSSSRVPSSPVSTSSSSSSSQSQSASSRPPQSAPSGPPPPPMAPPNNQMRQNIRRSLTDILYKRVSDSDDLNMSENEVGKLAVSIEKEMFGLCLNTDSKYKNKYRSLMFNLKDPKNKGLFYRVVWGDVSPFRLVRLSAEELLSKEISEWRKPDSSEVQSSSARPQIGQPKSGHRKESGPPDVDMEEAPPMSDGDVCISATSPSPRMAYTADQEEASPAVSSGPAQGPAAGVKSTSAMPDIFSTMLKDTTSEHRAHLFDLNCKICTGQRSADDEPATKKPKLSVKKPEVRSRQELRPSRLFSGDGGGQVSHPINAMTYSEPPPPGEEMSGLAPQPQTPAITQAVSSVSTITRRDPRMARHSSSGVTVTHTVQEVVASLAASLPLPVVVEPPAVVVAVEVVPKGPLPMPPAPPPSIPRPIQQKPASSGTEPPPEGETAIFLSGQEMMWKGFVNMHSVAKFVTKAYVVSGSFEHLKEDLPDTIHIGGRISPSTVWDYVGKLKTSLSKELCLIRFHPATEEEEVAYVSLFSYFSSRKKFGVVANNNRRIKDLYLIPLSSKDPLPSKLLPFDGPGLEPARPNLLLGLVICQKDKKRVGASLESEEKRSKTQNRDLDDTGLLKTTKSESKGSRHSQDLHLSTTPPGSPPALSSSETSSSSLATSSVLSFLSSVKAPANSTDKDSPSSSSSATSSAANATPLQTILKTLFGKKKQDSEASLSPSDQIAEVPPATLLDPIVQQFGLISKEKQVEEDEDDRPYDPEEEYDTSMGYDTVPKKLTLTVKEPEVINQPQRSSTEVDDVAYDPEDDTIFEEVKTEIPGHAKATPGGGAATGLTEQQKMLDDINKQIEVEKRQLEEQEESIRQQRSTAGTPAAAALFSVTDTLITQPPKALLANSQLLQLGKKVEELVKSSAAVPLINQRRDPRQSRDPRRRTSDVVEKEEVLAPVVETTPPAESTPPQQSVAEPQPETTPPEEAEVLTDAVPFFDSDTTEVSIPLLGEHMEPDMEVNYMEERVKTVKTEEVKTTKDETEMDKYSIWPNAASILKAGEIAGFEQNSQESASSAYFNISTNITAAALPTIPVLSSNVAQVGTTLGDSQSPHMSHLGQSGFHSDYRAPLDIPPPTTFPPQLAPPPMQGPPPMLGPPHMSVPPSMQGPPPMTGRPRPGEGDKSQYSQFGQPPGVYPPYQNQWGGSQQQPLPVHPQPQTIMPPRGPPPPFQPMDQRAPPPQMFNAPMGSLPPQHMGQRGPPPGQFIEGHNLSPHTFDGQNSLPPPRFSGPPPPFNYPGPRGPPPPFAGPPPGHFNTRLPPPSHFPGPSGPPPAHFGDHGGSQPRNIDPPRGPVDQYKNDSAGSYQQGMDQHQGQTPHMYKDNQAPPQGAPGQYRGPPHNQYEGRRGPPPSEEMSDQRFHPHNQFGSSRAPSPPPPHRSSFDDQRGGPPPPDHRGGGPPSQHFGGPQRYRLDNHPDDPRPARGPLLPTPPEGPIHLPNRMGGGHSPDSHRDEHWRRHSPDMRRRRSSTTREGSEPRSGERPSRFEGGRDRDREPVPGASRLSEERQRDLSEDRRRDRDREGPPHGGGRPWDRSQGGKRWSREREWDRGGRERGDRERERSRERDRERERSRERDRSRGREGERHREPEGERHREPEAERHRDPEAERHRDPEAERHRDPEAERHRDPEAQRPRDPEAQRHRDPEADKRREREREPRDRERDRGREREPERRDHDRDREPERRDHDRDREPERRDHDRDRPRNRDRERDRDRDRERERERDKDNRDRRRDRSRSRDRDRGKDRDRDRPRDRDRERDRERERDRDRRDRSRSKEKRDDKKENKPDVPKDSEKSVEVENDKNAS